MLALSLFRRRQPEYYAQLDQRGHCLALWQLSQRPSEGKWERVTELDPRWIGSLLPAHAVLPSRERSRANRWRLHHA